MATRVAILDDYQDVARAGADWDSLGDAVEPTFFHDHLADDDALVARLAPFDVVVAMRERTPFTRARLERLPALRLLVTTGMGNAAIDLAAAREHGVLVSGTRGIGESAAELTWALILAFLRHVPAEHAQMRAGGWQHTVGRDLDGATLGVVGLGRVGSRVATVGRAFGMDVIAWSQNLDAARAAELGATRVEKEELLERADVMTLHVKLSERTRGLVGARELALMKADALLVNTSRGPLVDEQALLAALRAGAIAGAALDVFDVEPLPVDHPLRTLPNVLLTPHVGYVTRRAYARFHREIVEDIAAWLAGAPVRVIG